MYALFEQVKLVFEARLRLKWEGLHYYPRGRDMAMQVDETAFKKLAIKQFPKLGDGRQSSETRFWGRYKV